MVYIDLPFATVCLSNYVNANKTRTPELLVLFSAEYKTKPFFRGPSAELLCTILSQKSVF